MLKIQNISVSIEGKPIFENASAVIPAGHKIGIVGRNGVGKTSLFRLIRGELEPESGQIDYPKNFRIGGVEQDGVWKVAVGSTEIKPHNRVVAVCSSHNLNKVRQLFC